MIPSFHRSIIPIAERSGAKFFLLDPDVMERKDFIPVKLPLGKHFIGQTFNWTGWAGRAAKCAEDIYFMFAVDPPKPLAEGKDGKYKGQSASNARNKLCVTK